MAHLQHVIKLLYLYDIYAAIIYYEDIEEIL